MNDIINKGNNWVDVSNLPRYTGKNRMIKWKDCKGCDIPYFYHGLYGIIHIKEILNDGNILVTLNSSEDNFKIPHEYVTNLMLSYLVGEKTFEYRYNIGDTIKVKQGYITIRKQIRIQMSKNTIYTQKGYEVDCSCCGHKFERTEYQLSKNNEIICPVCLGREVKVGFNDIATTDPWMIDYFVNKDDIHKYTSGSQQKVLFKCPICNKTKSKSILGFKQKGIGCCSDGISYGEKFLMKLFDIYNIEYKYQLSKTTFKWCENYRYDFYLPKYNWIVEVMGGQHYYKTDKYQPLTDIQKNDINKRTLAEKYVDNYIELDVRLSELEIIRESIINSDIKFIIDVNSVDYKLIHYHSKINSIILSICSEYQKSYPNVSTKFLSEKYKISQRTVGIHLKFGSKYGLCNYIPKTNIPIMLKRNNMTYVFNSIINLRKYLKTNFDIKIYDNQIHKFLDNDICYLDMLFYRISKRDFNTYYDNKNVNSIIVVGEKFQLGEAV